MKVRRLGSALAAVAIVVVVAVAVPSAANAASYPPVVPPVEVNPMTPAEWQAMVDAVPTIPAEEVALRKLQIQAGGLSAAEKASLNLNGVMTKMSPLARGNTVLTAFMVGFTIGAGGTRLVFAANGSDWDAAMCQLSPVVRDGYAFMSFGVGMSSCAQPITDPNADQALSYNSISYGGFTLQYRAQRTGVSVVTYCYTTSPGGTTLGLPAGTRYVFSGGYVYGGGGMNGQNTVSGCPTGANFVWPSTSGGPGGSLQTQTGTVLTEMTGTRADPIRQYRIGKKSRAGGGYSAVGGTVSSRDSQGIPLGALADGLAGAGDLTDVGGLAIQEYNPSTGAWNPVLESPLDTATQQELDDHPDCYDGSQQCTLTLRAVKGTAVNECLTGKPAACASWWTDTLQGTQPVTADGTQYECRWGSYTVDLQRCAVYQQSFKTGTSTDTGVITDPGGTPLPSQSTGSTSPNTINPGAQVGGSNQSCMDTWFDDFNPIDWVLTPVKCALVWAFVPRTEVITQVQTQLSEAWAPTIVGKLPTVVQAAIVIPDGGGGCTGPAVDIPIHFGAVNVEYHGYPLSACTEPMATLAGWARLIGAAVLIWFTGLGIIRRASAVVNAPGVGGGPA